MNTINYLKLANYRSIDMLELHDIQPFSVFAGPWAFYPPPKVESSVVQLRPYLTPPVSIVNQQHFAQIVARAFSQRRKMLRNTLKGLLEINAIEAAGINPQVRAETLTLEDFAKLANATADDGDIRYAM